MSRKEKSRNWTRMMYKQVYRPDYEAIMELYPFTIDDLSGEIWKPISRYEGLYHVSNFGRTKRFFKNGNVKILRPQISNHGRLHVTLSKEGKEKKFLVNRLVALAFIPNPDDLPEVDHIDGCKLNNHADNLRWVTDAENKRAAAVVLSLAKSKFKDEATIIYIRDNPDHLTGKELAEMFHCDPKRISEIQCGQTYVNAGGAIRESKNQPLSPEQKAEIRRLYVKGSKEFGSTALAKMFGCEHTTVLRIVKKD